ncbi:hypothetical protein BBK82_05245 [Lentzea guizhouensis]|uniref:Uncharacterized protein n=1 Tax=Lentzea guizhouensis TaxID=1586287 RepID=A0A1B2HCW3_9PSEU|nr:hypothetical protein BBK82_05245 [Lentzea guizhouensis]
MGIGLVVAVLVVQAVASLVWSADATLTGLALVFNAVAAVSTTLFALRGGRASWVVVGWCAGFFGWHALGLGEIAGWWTTGLEAAFSVAGAYQPSVVYQAVMTAAAGFAVHLLLPRQPQASAT